ncbi:MAG: serine hydrolase domain-containing protein [Bacteroidota bacterium]
MKSTVTYISIFIAFLCAQCTMGQEKRAIHTDTIHIPQLELIANAFLESTGLPGLSIAISENAELSYAQAFGFADTENEIKLTPQHQLRTASVAKVITITGLGRLVTQGKIDLDAPIRDYIPYVDSKYALLTCRQLAGHTSGVAHQPSGRSYKKKQFKTIKEAVLLMDKPLLFQPDTDYHYSTSAFTFLAAAIEGAAGKPYKDFMREDIFAPLEMTQTFPENISKLTEKDANLYYIQKGKLKKEKLTNASYKLAGAGFRSTPADLVKMMKAYSNGFISKAVANDLFRARELENGAQTLVGVTWRNSIDLFGHSVVEHAGNWRGARSVIVYYPDENLSISVMINAQCSVLIEQMAHIFAQLYRTRKNRPADHFRLKEPLELTFRKDQKKTNHKGILTLADGKGNLTAEVPGFLKASELYSLGPAEEYVMVTIYGLLYLKLDTLQTTTGKVFAYSTLNELHPLKKPALICFRKMDTMESNH